jgi:hypothetical protein
VVVSENRETTVHLEGGDSDDSAVDQNDAVRLPDGNIVGSRTAQ